MNDLVTRLIQLNEDAKQQYLQLVRGMEIGMFKVRRSNIFSQEFQDSQLEYFKEKIADCEKVIAYLIETNKNVGF